MRKKTPDKKKTVKKETPYVDGNLIQAKPICGAKTRNGKNLCKGKPMENGRCRLHGGATPKGVASPNFKTGRYSKYLPEKLAEKFHTAVSDAELISVRDDIGLVDTHIAERLEKLYSGESKDWWFTLRLQFNDLEAIITKNAEAPTDETEAALVDILERMGESINNGTRLFSVYEQVQPMIEQRRKLVETESKRLKDLDQNITVEKAMSIIHLLADTVKRHVTDPKQLAAISEELARAVG